MKVDQERLTFLKNLYERKFYDENKAKSTLEKVMNFQKKLQQFKGSKTQNVKFYGSPVNFILETQPQKFRPITTYSLSRMKKCKMSKSLQNQTFEGPATSQLRLILSGNKTKHVNFLSENMRQRHLYSHQQNRKRSKFLYPHNTIEQSNQPLTRLSNSSKIDDVSQERKAMTSERKVRSSRREKQGLYYTIKENEQDIPHNRKMMFRGTNFQRDVEGPFESFKEINQRTNYDQKQKVYIGIAPAINKKLIQLKKRERKSSIKTRMSNNSKGKQKSRFFQSNPKEDIIQNLQLDPWHVDDTNYA